MTAMTLITKYRPSIQQSCLHLQACVLNFDVAHIKEQSFCDQNAFNRTALPYTFTVTNRSNQCLLVHKTVPVPMPRIEKRMTFKF